MAHAYTPGLKVIPKLTVRRRRLLPIPGEVLVKVGGTAKADDVVARTELPGRVHSINVANRMGVEADEMKEYLTKKVGDKIWAEESLAENDPWIKFFKTTIPSPITGTVESISEITGTEGTVISLQDIFTFDQQGIDSEGSVVGELVPTGIRPQCLERIQRAGYGTKSSFGA